MNTLEQLIFNFISKTDPISLGDIHIAFEPFGEMDVNSALKKLLLGEKIFVSLPTTGVPTYSTKKSCKQTADEIQKYINEEYEKARKPMPIPKDPWPGRTRPWIEPQNIDKPKCPVCGMVFDGPMSYCCMNSKCPGKFTC